MGGLRLALACVLVLCVPPTSAISGHLTSALPLGRPDIRLLLLGASMPELEQLLATVKRQQSRRVRSLWRGRWFSSTATPLPPSAPPAPRQGQPHCFGTCTPVPMAMQLAPCGMPTSPTNLGAPCGHYAQHLAASQGHILFQVSKPHIAYPVTNGIHQKVDRCQDFVIG